MEGCQLCGREQDDDTQNSQIEEVSMSRML